MKLIEALLEKLGELYCGSAHFKGYQERTEHIVAIRKECDEVATTNSDRIFFEKKEEEAEQEYSGIKDEIHVILDILGKAYDIKIHFNTALYADKRFIITEKKNENSMLTPVELPDFGFGGDDNDEQEQNFDIKGFCDIIRKYDDR